MTLNLPNRITLIRIFLIPVFIAVFFITPLAEWRFLIAAIVFALAAATDALDGRRFDRRTVVQKGI